jgi:tetratricopeptide (TPR) repeat protein/transcriptional regulator with XRE-family HTH domain
MATGASLTFGGLLKHYRLAAGLTQEALAERAGLSVRAISDFERDTRRVPRHDTIHLLTTALHLSAQERAMFEAAAHQGGTSSAHARAGLSPGARTMPTRLVGRVRELAALERHLAGDGPPVLLLAGPPGIGKSRLLQEAAHDARQAGWTVLAGGCQRQGGHEPYAPLLGALQQHIQGQQPVHLRAELRSCAWLVRLLPELADGPIEPLPAWTLPPAQERRLMVEAVGRFLRNVAGPAGTLLLLDDLQWADPDALEVLATLMRAVAAVPLRVVGAYRDTEVAAQDPLSVLLADLAQAGLASHRTLAALTREEAEQLLDGLWAGRPDDRTALREPVLQRAGGLPFFLVSCAQAVQQGEGEGAREEDVPWDVAQSVRQRVAALPAGAREVMGTAAVVGRVVPYALLTRVTTRLEGEVLAAIRAACRARLLEEQGRDVCTFAHDVIREVVEADLGAAQRAVLHRRVAEVLEQQPEPLPVDLLAYHYTRSPAQDKALLYLEQAGDRAQAQYANVAAEGYFRELVDRLDSIGPVLDAARAREKLGAALRTQARYEAALEVLDQAAETYRVAGDLESMGRTLAEFGRVHISTGTPDEGVRHIQPLLEHLEAQPPSRVLAALHTVRAGLLCMSGRYGEQLAAADRAIEIATALEANSILSEAWNYRGEALGFMGRIEEALHALGEATRRADTAGNLMSLGRSLAEMGWFHLYRGDFEASHLCTERALAVGERQGDPLDVASMLCGRGWLAFCRGNWDGARADLEQAMAINRRIGVSWDAALPPLFLGLLCLAEGSWETASRHLQDSSAMAERSGDPFVLRWAQSLLAECDLLAGHAEAACTRLRPLLDQPGLEELVVTTDVLPRLAWAHLELGDTDPAANVAAQAVRRARAANTQLGLADALRIQAMVRIRQEHCAEAEHALEEGLSLVRSMPYPYAEARLLHVYGELHLQRGEPQQARERLDAALAIFRRLGARKDAERVEQALAMLSQNRMAGPFEMRVSDAQWAQIQALLPPRAPTGRPRADDRRILEAILYVRRRGCAWATLPAELGDGATVHRRWRQWQAAGLWARIEAILGAPSALDGPDQPAPPRAEPREEAG